MFELEKLDGFDHNHADGDDNGLEDGLGDGHKGCPRAPKPQFFLHCSKGGGDQTHVQKICCKLCMILKAFWQHKIDIKRLFKGRNVSIWG